MIIKKLEGTPESAPKQKRVDVFMNSLRSMLHWRVICLIISNLFWGCSASMYLVLLPDYARQNGITAQQISMILITFGVVSSGWRLFCIFIGKQFVGYKLYL